MDAPRIALWQYGRHSLFDPLPTFDPHCLAAQVRHKVHQSLLTVKVASSHAFLRQCVKKKEANLRIHHISGIYEVRRGTLRGKQLQQSGGLARQYDWPPAASLRTLSLSLLTQHLLFLT